MRVVKHNRPRGATLEVSSEEYEILCMGLHALIGQNFKNAQRDDIPATLEHGDVVIETANIFADTHVDISKVLDQMVEAWGYDPAVEG